MIIDLQEDKCTITSKIKDHLQTKSVDLNKVIDSLSLEKTINYNLLPHNTRHILRGQGKLYITIERSRFKNKITLDEELIGEVTIPKTIFIFILNSKADGFKLEHSYVFAINDSRIAYDYTDFLIPHFPGVNKSGEIDWAKRYTNKMNIDIDNLNSLDKVIYDFLNKNLKSSNIKVSDNLTAKEQFLNFEDSNGINFNLLQSPTFNTEVEHLIQNVFNSKERRSAKLAFIKKVN